MSVDVNPRNRRPARVKTYIGYVNPERVEAVLNTVRWVKETGVSARGIGEQRRLVAFVVMEEDRLLRESIDDLEQAKNSRLQAYMRPAIFVQVDHLPKDGLGHIRRDLLAKGSVEDRQFKAPRRQLNIGTLKFAVIQDPINRVSFEGAVAFPPKVERKGAVVVVLAHKERGSRHVKRVTFRFPKGSKEALELVQEERVVVTGIIDRWGSYKGLEIHHVTERTRRMVTAETEDVMASLL